MQVIAVERWTFWSAVVLAATGPALSSGIGDWVYTQGPSTAISLQVGGVIAGLVFVLLLVSVLAGGTRDPSVRSIPPLPRT